MGRLYCTVQFLSSLTVHTHPWRCESLQTSNISGAAAAAANAQIEFPLFHLKQTLAVSITEPANQRLVGGLVPCVYIHYKKCVKYWENEQLLLGQQSFRVPCEKKGVGGMRATGAYGSHYLCLIKNITPSSSRDTNSTIHTHTLHL